MGEQAHSRLPAEGLLPHAMPWGALLCVLVSAPVQALEQIRATLPELSVSASALPITEAAASQHVTVVTRRDLDALGNTGVAEVLARQAGIVVDRSPRTGGYGSIYLRGADPTHVVVLVDHVRQNDPLSSRGSAVDLNTLSTGDLGNNRRDETIGTPVPGRRLRLALNWTLP